MVSFPGGGGVLDMSTTSLVEELKRKIAFCTDTQRGFFRWLKGPLKKLYPCLCFRLYHLGYWQSWFNTLSPSWSDE